MKSVLLERESERVLLYGNHSRFCFPMHNYVIFCFLFVALLRRSHTVICFCFPISVRRIYVTIDCQNRKTVPERHSTWAIQNKLQTRRLGFVGPRFIFYLTSQKTEVAIKKAGKGGCMPSTVIGLPPVPFDPLRFTTVGTTLVCINRNGKISRRTSTEEEPIRKKLIRLL